MSQPATQGDAVSEWRFWRNKHGTTIHRDSCRYAPNGQPWKWAQGRPPSEIWFTALCMGYHLCRICKPVRRA